MHHLKRIAAITFLASTVGGAAGYAADAISVGVEIPVSVANVPMLVAIDRLKSEGYDAKAVEFQSPETMTLAMQQGQIDLLGTSVGTAFAGISAGLEAEFVVGLAKSDFEMVAKSDIKSCEDLAGRNLAIHSYEGTTGTLTMRWLAEKCPNVKPNIMIVPGSENRVAGLLAGQLDASPIDSQSAMQLMKERPGDFGLISSFSETTPLASVYVASKSFLADHADAAKALGSTYAEVVKEMTNNPQLLVDEAIARVENVDKETLTDVAHSWIEHGMFVPVWGVEPKIVDEAIDFYSDGKGFPGIENGAAISTTQYVESK